MSVVGSRHHVATYPPDAAMMAMACRHVKGPFRVESDVAFTTLQTSWVGLDSLEF